MGRKTIVLLIVAFLLGHLSSRWLGGNRGPDGEGGSYATALAETAGEFSAVSLDQLSDQEQRNIEIFRANSPSVVYISNFAVRRDFFSLNATAIPRGTGSGFVWDEEGHVVTNYHVIAEGNRWNVSLGEEDWEAQLVGVAPNKDLAVLRIEAPRELLRPLMLGSSSQLVVGQGVLAIGNPFGLDRSLTVGVVSALGRELTSPGGLTIRDVIQTDAAINPGNSGGPLFDSQGRLVGVNTAIYSPSGGSAGIGFAVPVDTVQRLVPQLIQYGKPVQPGIGVELVSDRWAQRFRIQGVIVHNVQPGGPAARAGLEGLQQDRRGRVRLGDVIVAVNGESITSLDDLVLSFEEIGVGGKAVLTLERDRRSRDVEVRLVAVQ